MNKHHLATCKPTPVVQELEQNLYVDDYLGGADSDLSQLHTILLEIVLDKAERIFRKKEIIFRL